MLFIDIFSLHLKDNFYCYPRVDSKKSTRALLVPMYM